LGEWLRPASRAYSPRQLDELERLIAALAAFDGNFLDAAIDQSAESVEEFEQFGAHLQIDFEDYHQQEQQFASQSQMKLLQRLRALFQPIALDPTDPNFAAAFCGGMR
jgi:hypothetical protein